MIEAWDALRKTFPAQYPVLLQSADLVSAVYAKQKKFDLAAGVYQPLVGAPQPKVAATAQGKIGDAWLAGAKTLQGASDQPEAVKRLDAAAQAFIAVLKNYPDQLGAVDGAFRGLGDILVQRRSWGLLKQPDFEGYLAKLTDGLTGADLPTRVELAKAGLVFLDKRSGEKEKAAALARFKAAISARPGLALTRTGGEPLRRTSPRRQGLSGRGGRSTRRC